MGKKRKRRKRHLPQLKKQLPLQRKTRERPRRRRRRRRRPPSKWIPFHHYIFLPSSWFGSTPDKYSRSSLEKIVYIFPFFTLWKRTVVFIEREESREESRAMLCVIAFTLTSIFGRCRWVAKLNIFITSFKLLLISLF